MSNWIGEPQRLIVAAACRVQGVVFVGVRHYDSVMNAQMIAAGFSRTNISEVEQGFIDNRGNFLNREEALEVAFNANQINQRRTKTDPEDVLFSEDLW